MSLVVVFCGSDCVGVCGGYGSVGDSGGNYVGEYC